MLARHGVTLRGIDTDTMLASYLLDATRSGHLIEDLSLEHTNYKALSEEDICGRGVKAISLAEVPVEAAITYACERADLAGQLAPLLRETLEREQLTDVYTGLERPLVPVLIAIERAGVRIDTAALAVQSQKVDQELAQRSRDDLRDGRRRVQHQLAEAAGGSAVRQAAAPGAQANRRPPRRRQPRSKSSRNWR